MPHRRDTTNCKASLRPDQRSICLAQNTPRQPRCFCCIYLMSTRCQKQHGRPIGFRFENDGFGDLIKMTSDTVRGFLCGPGLSDLADISGKTGALKRSTHAGQAFAHIQTFLSPEEG